MPRSSTCKFWRRGFLSAYLEGTDEKNAEARFYKGVGRRPVEKFKSVHGYLPLVSGVPVSCLCLKKVLQAYPMPKLRVSAVGHIRAIMIAT